MEIRMLYQTENRSKSKNSYNNQNAQLIFNSIEEQIKSYKIINITTYMIGW